MNVTLKIAKASVALCFIAFATSAFAVEDGYPLDVITMENMRLSKPMKIDLPKSTTRKSKEVRTVVIVAHVAKDGHVLKSKIQEASGAHHVDEAVLVAVRDFRFAPYIVGGQPTEVSVVMPIHLAADDIRRGQ